MATKAILAALDSGPLECAVFENEKLYDRSVAEGGTHKAFHILLPSAIVNHTCDPEVFEQLAHLHHLLATFNGLTEVQKAHSQAHHLALFIFLTNRIEFVGPETVGDTVDQLRRHNDGLTADPHVGSMSDTNSQHIDQDQDQEGGTTFVSRLFDEIKILKVHRDMTDNITLDGDSLAGMFRTSGRNAQSARDTPPHVFLNHKSITAAVRMLLQHLYRLSRAADEYVDAATRSEDRTLRRLACAFSLGAYIQFHFVDIHPFGDGNGRMCRLLCKRFLDAVMPVPVPMFHNRDLYIETLDECRALSSVVPLVKLLLQEAVSAMITASYVPDNSYRGVYVVSDVTSLEQQLRLSVLSGRSVADDDRDELLDAIREVDRTDGNIQVKTKLGNEYSIWFAPGDGGAAAAGSGGGGGAGYGGGGAADGGDVPLTSSADIDAL